MQEIRFHGRGGQGTVVASVILAKAFFKAGLWVQTFPVFGVERRGAPVEAYLRLDDKKILIRSNLYAPDHIVVQDAKLLDTADVTKGLKQGGWILLNSSKMPDNLAKFKGFRLAMADAGQIGIRHRLGTRTQPIINTAMIGAFVRILESPPIDMLADAIREEMAARQEENVAAAKEAYDSVQIIGNID